MKLSTRVGLTFVVVGFLVGFFDRQIFGRGNPALRLGAVLAIGVACMITMFALKRRERRRP